jgi:DNA-binding Lrp family transcriptional regulator
VTDWQTHLLDGYQRGLPLHPRPFAVMAEALGVTEEEVLSVLHQFRDQGLISRVGAVLRPQTVGASTLAAMAVSPPRLESVARLVNRYREVNHNYAREHYYSLWFVITAPDRERVQQVIAEIAAATGLEVLDLPMVRDFHIDLGFRLWA